MLTLPPSVRIFIATAPCDMRKSIDGLSAMVVNILQRSPYEGHLFLFHGRSGDRIKILVWGNNGFWLFYRRLERGRFKFPSADSPTLEMTGTELALLLDGLDPILAKKVPRLQPKVLSPSMLGDIVAGSGGELSSHALS